MSATIVIRRISETAEKVEVANLLYKNDGQFVPVTPLSFLRESTNFYKAVFDDVPEIRAASSYEEWLRGCAAGAETANADTTVYELASSIVHDPMGGFRDPSLQQVFSFTRLMVILYPYLSSRQTPLTEGISVVAAIAAANQRSHQAMLGLGMKPINPLPKWLEYEHRNWFPKLTAGSQRRIDEEAHYLWFPPEAVKTLFQRLAPYADGSKALVRKKHGDPTVTETYKIKIDVEEYGFIVAQFGSLSKALDEIPYEIFRAPPQCARLNGGTF